MSARPERLIVLATLALQLAVDGRIASLSIITTDHDGTQRLAIEGDGVSMLYSAESFAQIERLSTPPHRIN